jgi:hypothetical protein
MPGRRETPADEFYLAARDAVISAARAQIPRGRGRLRVSDGAVITVNWRTPLRVFLLILWRRTPGQGDGWTGFNFQRNGRVGLAGNRSIPLGQALGAGSEAWATRQDLLDLAVQIEHAKPY